MDVSDNIKSQFKGQHLLVGICGRAGAGKTTLAKNLAKDIGANVIIYSGDWRFKHNSDERKKLFSEKWKAGIDAYMNVINQYTWWDFEKIAKDIDTLSKGEKLEIKDAYDRTTGTKDMYIEIESKQKSIILYENCILGGIEILEKLDIIIFVNTSDDICFSRIVKKDLGRRTMTEIATRFLITSFSENKFFSMLFDRFFKKTLISDSNGNFTNFPTLHKVEQLPVYINDTTNERRTKGTIFCDLDGTLIKHIPVPSEDGSDLQLLPKTVEKLNEWYSKGYYIILTSSRPYYKIFSILNKLSDMNIKFDQIICDLPVGPRHIINDSKGSEIRAIAHELKRDEGVGNVEIE